MFKERSNKKELLDAPHIPAEHLAQNLRELHTINTYLGGYRLSKNALKNVLSPKKPAVVVDIGSGGGDTVLRLHKWSMDQSYSLQLKGIDVNPDCVNYSIGRTAGVPGIQFICDDYKKVKFHVPDVDVLHASLFCHHLSEGEIIDLLRFAKENRITLVINDLERHPLAYYAISFLTRLFSRSYLVKNDAPLSVLRGFTKKEWKSMLGEAGIERYSLRSRFAFRHEVIVYHNG